MLIYYSTAFKKFFKLIFATNRQYTTAIFRMSFAVDILYIYSQQVYRLNDTRHITSHKAKSRSTNPMKSYQSLGISQNMSTDIA